MRNNNISTLASNIKEGIEARLKDLHTASPGIIESFDPVTQTASIQPAIRRVFKLFDGEKEILTPTDLPILINVPIQFPRGGGFSMTFPVAKGDECLLVFCERSIDNWHNSGGVQDPRARRFHSLSDATAFVGLSSLSNSVPDYDPVNMQIRKDDGSAAISITPNGDIALISEQVVLVQADHVAINGDTTLTLNGNSTINGDLTVNGDITADNVTGTTDVTGGGISVKTHTHIGSPTAATGPVTPTGLPQ